MLAERERAQHMATGDTEALSGVPGNRLLASMGKLGRDFIDLVQAHQPQVTTQFAEPGDDTLLHGLQSDILNRRHRGTAGCPATPLHANDCSVQVHVCHSRMREVEVLYDQLVRLFELSPALQPADVLVMTPDIDAYAPLIEAVFTARASDRSLPFSIADRSPRAESPLVNGFFALLDLPGSRYAVNQLCTLLELAAIQRRFAFEARDLPLVHRWLRETGVRWGIDHDSRAAVGLPAIREHTWRAGLDRLLLGYALPGDYGQFFADLLPYDAVEGADAQVLGRLHTFTDAAFRLATTLREPRSVDQWVTTLSGMLEQFFQPDEAEELAVQTMRSALQHLGQTATQASFDASISLDVITSWLRRSLETSEWSTRFLTGGVTFCALVPMRSLPFDVVCLLGMDYVNFPHLRVASVQLGQDNIFDSWEALELERVLRAVAQPTSESLVRSALATVRLGATGEHLAELRDDEQAWEERVTAFQEYHRLWQDAGFARLFRTLISQEQVDRRLLGFQAGERRLTNLLHVAELLQAAADRQRTGMTGLLKWLAERRQTRAAEDEEEQLRLESDEHLVKIVTIHKSKGLEYPIAFCPFLWSGRLWSLKESTLSFHHPDDDYHPVLDLGSPRLEDSRVHACREEVAENLRLLYVALTRAKHCCYLVWGAIRDIGTSPLAWLLHQPERVDGTLTIDVVEAHVNGRYAAELRSDVERRVALANGGIRIEPLRTDPGEPYQPPSHSEPTLAARRFPGPIHARWRMTSFSSLAADSGAELPDYDAIARPLVLEPQVPEPSTIFTFPRGVRAGRCLHAMFERLDFTQQERGVLDCLVAQCLAEHGFDAAWLPVVADMVERVVTAPLDDTGVLSLRQIPLERRLIELEFYYPLAGLTCEGLQRVLNAHGFAGTLRREEIERLSFAPTRGYMKGFIDLVFEAEGRYYLVDYKSNWLGSTAEAYRRDALHRVMAHELYYLQYLIYTLAVHRYLRLRLPGYHYDTHFGGVWYLFVRGVDPAFPTCGIFHDRPARNLIEALDTYLATGSPRS